MKYKVAIWEEMSGYIDVEAKSQEEAEQIAVELMDDYGCNKIFNGVDLRQYNGDFSHRKAEVITCEEINVTYNDKITEEDGNGHEVIAPTKR